MARPNVGVVRPFVCNAWMNCARTAAFVPAVKENSSKSNLSLSSALIFSKGGSVGSFSTFSAETIGLIEGG